MTPDNLNLLLGLMRTHGTRDLGTMSYHNFFDTHVDWRCPCCLRTKTQITRPDKHGKLLCAIVGHHDHFLDAVRKKLTSYYEYEDMNAVIASFRRFDTTLICQDCNTADADAKDYIKAPANFSFAPHEIRNCIVIQDGKSHELQCGNLGYVYDVAKPVVEYLSRQLRDLLLKLESGDDWLENCDLSHEPAIKVYFEGKRKRKVAQIGRKK